ncbi:MAG TPA: PAS domain-containing protein [Solirubrobacteraceae bacterium]|nr:PAS domain-containing protein [Solirubrobacteraceae bacterium]
MTTWAPRPRLRLIQGALEDVPEWSWFCSQCAAVPDQQSVSPRARACRSCGTGLLLETRADALPAAGDAFLVVNSGLRIRALSRHAETLLDARGEDLIDRPVAEFLAAADAETRGPGDLIAMLYAASTESDRLHAMFVRPLDAFGVRLVARIAPCGPPRAALVVLRGGARARELHVVPGPLGA